MSKIRDFIERIKAIFNKNPRLEAINKVAEEEISLKSNATYFKEDLKKIYSRQDAMNKIIEELKINEKLINNKTAFLEITSTLKDILDERDNTWSKSENSISNDELQHMIYIIKESKINPEKINYRSIKNKGLKQSSILVDNEGNVTIQKMAIYGENENILSNDEFTSTTLSINEGETLHKEGFSIKLDESNINELTEENATRKFSMDYDENGEVQKIATKNFKIVDGKNVLINEHNEEGENLLTLDDINQRDKFLKYIDKTGKEGIESLFQKNPDFLDSFKGIVKEQIVDKMIDYDFSYIKYDTSNNPDLYKKSLKNLMSEIDKFELYRNGQYEEAKQWEISRIKPILEEIENPKKVEDGMYKIPQKYLFEAIRMGADLYQKENDSKLDHFISASPFVGKYSNDNIQSYLYMDGKLTIEQGKKMEELYEDKNNYILQHKYGIMSEPNKKAECFQNGKKSSTYDKSEKNRLECTTTGTYNHTMSFSEFITNDCNKIVISIPREAFEPNSDIPVWGANEQDGDSFILPEYVIGNYGPEGFEENPIPLEKRTQYLLNYKDNSTIPMENYQNRDEEKDL